jgi:hypothetical protein
MEKYVIGRVFELDNEKRYVVLGITNIDDAKYILVAPTSGDGENVKIDNSRPMVLKVDEESDDVEYIDDVEIVKKVLEEV